MVTSRTHLSIGDVLTLLREEFPDVTISKIRFLESQGLVNPERSPSGYRKFYDHDVERLRWVLRQQRENFLPLKVIRYRLAETGGQLPPDEDPPEAGTTDDRGPQEPAAGGHDSAARPLADEGLVRNGSGDHAVSSARIPEPTMVLAEAQPVRRPPALAESAAAGESLGPAPTGTGSEPRDAGSLGAEDSAAGRPSTGDVGQAGPRLGDAAERPGYGEAGRGMLPGFVLGHAAEDPGTPGSPGALSGPSAGETVASDPSVRSFGGPIGHETAPVTPAHARGSDAEAPACAAGPEAVDAQARTTGDSGSPGGSSDRPEVSKGSEATDATDDGQSDAAAVAAPDADSGPPTRTRGGSGRDSSRSAASGNASDESLALSFDVSLGVSGVSLTIEELCGATGLSAAEIAALEGFGLVEPLTVAGGRYYDECAAGGGAPRVALRTLRGRTPSPAAVPQRGRPRVGPRRADRHAVATTAQSRSTPAGQRRGRRARHPGPATTGRLAAQGAAPAPWGLSLPDAHGRPSLERDQEFDSTIRVPGASGGGESAVGGALHCCHGRSSASGCPSRPPIEHSCAAVAGDRGRGQDASHLHWHARGDRDRVRPPRGRHAPADDP